MKNGSGIVLYSAIVSSGESGRFLWERPDNRYAVGVLVV